MGARYKADRMSESRVGDDMKIEQLPGFSRVLGIEGFKISKEATMDGLVDSIRDRNRESCIQLFDSDKVAGVDHLRSAVLNAMKAFTSKTNVSENLAVEILLYASARTQIGEAIRLLGATNKTKNLALVIVADTDDLIHKSLSTIHSLIPGTVDDSILDQWSVDEVIRLFHIKKEEIQATRRRREPIRSLVCKLVLERIAILSARS